MGERLAKQWNLPTNVLNCLEGRELYLRPKRLAHLCLYADLLAAGLVSGKGPLAWENLFSSLEEVDQSIKSFSAHATHLPAPIVDFLPAKIERDEPEAQKYELGPFLPEEALKLTQKALVSLCEEIQARGRLFYLEGQELFAADEGGLEKPPENLMQLLKEDEIITDGRLIYIPIRFKKTPALLLSLETESPLPPGEFYGLRLVRKTLESLLERL